MPTCLVLLALAACSPKGEALYARAAASLGQGDTRAALIDLKNLVGAEPQNARARALLGQALIESGDVTAAEIEVQKARDLGATGDVLLVAACQLHAAKGEFDQVFSDCQPASAPAAARADLQLVQGRALLGSRKAAEAKTLYQALVAAEPGNVEALLGLAGAVQLMDGAPAAMDVMTKAPEQVKSSTKYWLALAGLSMLTGDLKSAEASYRTALARVEEHPDARQKIMALGGLTETQLRQDDLPGAEETSRKLIKLAPKYAAALQLRAQVAAAGGNYDEARSLLEKVVTDQPGNLDARLLLGIVNVQQGNLDQAEMHFSAVVTEQPDNTRAQRLLAELRAQQGSPADTLATVESALTSTSNDPGMLAMASRMSLASGNRDQALAYLAAASHSTAPSTPQAQLEIANGYLLAGETDKALEILQAMPADGAGSQQRDVMVLMTLLRKGDDAQLMAKSKELLARSGDDPNVRNTVGGIYGAAGKYDLAREQFSAALKLDPKNLQALLGLAKVDLVRNKPELAEASFKRILEIEPKDLNATLGLAVTANARKDKAGAGKYLAKAAADHPDSVEANVALAQFYLANSQADKARAQMDAAVAANPKNAGMANARGLVSMASKDIAGAIANFEQATVLEPKSEQYPLNLARAKLANNDAKGALAVIDAVLKDSPRSVQALGLGAATSLQTGDVERATGYVERMRQAAPDAAVTYQFEGDLANAQKRYTDAAAFYEKADPGLRDRNITMARFGALDRSQSLQAGDLLGRWLVAHPDDTGAAALLGEYKRSRGDEAGAIAVYETALKQSPDAGVLNNNLAVIYQAKGDPRALQAAEKAYKALPNVPAVVDTYGWILLGAGKTDEAVRLLQQASQALPDNAEIQYHYAAALAKAGRKPEALPVVKKAIGGTLPASVRGDAQKLLTELSR